MFIPNFYKLFFDKIVLYSYISDERKKEGETGSILRYSNLFTYLIRKWMQCNFIITFDEIFIIVNSNSTNA